MNAGHEIGRKRFPTGARGVVVSCLALASACSDAPPPPVGTATRPAPATTTPDTTTPDSASAPTKLAPKTSTGVDPAAQVAASTPPASESARGLRHASPAAFDGYTLIAPLSQRSVYLVDLAGQVVHEWKTQHLTAGGSYLLPNGNLLRCARDEKNPRSLGGGIGGLTQEIDWDGNVVWECDLVAQGYTQHHDLEPLPNGNVLLLVREFHDHDEGVGVGRDPSFRRTSALWSDVVIEVEPVRPSGAKIVWTWRAWDHLVQDFDEKAAHFGDPSAFPGRIDVNADYRYKPKKRTETDEARARRERIAAQMAAVGYAGGEVPDDAPGDAPSGDAPPKPADVNPLAPHDTASETSSAPDPRTVPKLGEDWLHTNGIDYLPEYGLIALSTPRLSEVWVLDRSTTTAEAATESGGRYGHGGALLYRWGNAQSYASGGPDDRRLYYQHDVTWVASTQPNELRFLVFNNGQQRPGREFSSVEEVAVPFDAQKGFVRTDSQPFGPREPTWTYSDPDRFYAGFISGAQRLPNGNTLICEGTKGRVFEVQQDGTVVWDYWSPFDDPNEALAPTAALFQAQRIGKDDPALRGKLGH